MNGIQFKINATPQQLQALEEQCQLSEALMAATLAKRIEGLKAEESVQFILDWFKSVRHMAHGNWISCGIQCESGPLGQPLPDEAKAKAARTTRMNQVVALLDKAGIKLEQPWLEELFNALK